MDTDNEPKSYEVFKGPPSDALPADKKADDSRTNGTDDATKGKDESESYMDYNGNSEQNAPARSK